MYRYDIYYNKTNDKRIYSGIFRECGGCYNYVRKKRTFLRLAETVIGRKLGCNRLGDKYR